MYHLKCSILTGKIKWNWETSLVYTGYSVDYSYQDLSYYGENGSNHFISDWIAVCVLFQIELLCMLHLSFIVQIPFGLNFLCVCLEFIFFFFGKHQKKICSGFWVMHVKDKCTLTCLNRTLHNLLKHSQNDTIQTCLELTDSKEQLQF